MGLFRRKAESEVDRLRRERERLWKEFQDQGGRGVELAEEIDLLDDQIEFHQYGEGTKKSRVGQSENPGQDRSWASPSDAKDFTPEHIMLEQQKRQDTAISTDIDNRPFEDGENATSDTGPYPGDEVTPGPALASAPCPTCQGVGRVAVRKQAGVFHWVSREDGTREGPFAHKHMAEARARHIWDLGDDDEEIQIITTANWPTSADEMKLVKDTYFGDDVSPTPSPIVFRGLPHEARLRGVTARVFFPKGAETLVGSRVVLKNSGKVFSGRVIGANRDFMKVQWSDTGEVTDEKKSNYEAIRV